METESIKGKIKFFAQVVEKFVEDNLMEKEQRDENLRKLALAFETFVKDNPLRNSNARASEFGETQSDVQTSGATVKPVTHQKISVRKWPHFKGELPKYQSEGASGFDVRAQITETLILEAGQRALVPTGLSFALPQGYELQARPRSGWAIRDGITLLNTPGTIDADYRGEVKVILVNLGEKPVTIQDQDRIAQLVLAPVVQADFEVQESLDDTGRGAGGFGSTGKS